MTSTTTTTTTTTTSTPPPPSSTPVTLPPTPVHTTPRVVLPTRPRTHRPISSPNPFVTTETTRKIRPRITTTDRPTTKAYEKPPPRKVTIADSQDSPTSHVPHIIVASHPRENQVYTIYHDCKFINKRKKYYEVCNKKYVIFSDLW